MFLSVVLFTPNSLCVSVRGLVLSVFLSVEQFTPNSVFFCQSYISRITVCFCPWYGSRITLCVFLSMVQFSVFFCLLLLLFCPSYSFSSPRYSSRLAQSLPGLWDTSDARHGSFLGLCPAHLLYERAENLQSSGASGCGCRRSVQVTMVVFIRRHLLLFLSTLSSPSSHTRHPHLHFRQQGSWDAAAELKNVHEYSLP